MCSINHELKAIFIHIPKNGGCFIENILCKYYGFELDYIIKPDNYGFDENEDTISLSIQKKGVLHYYMNSKYINEKYEMTPEKWKTYYKFTFVRNPYTKIISSYEFLRNEFFKDNTNNKWFPTFQEFLKIQTDSIEHDFYKQSHKMYYRHYYHTFIRQNEHLLNNDNKINIDFIGSFENLNEDLIKILKKIGVNQIKHINKIEQNIKINISVKKDIDFYYDDKILDFVNNYFKDDFIIFQYPMYDSYYKLKENIHIKNEEIDFINKNKAILDSLTLHHFSFNMNGLDSCLFASSMQKGVKTDINENQHLQSNTLVNYMSKTEPNIVDKSAKQLQITEKNKSIYIYKSVLINTVLNNLSYNTEYQLPSLHLCTSPSGMSDKGNSYHALSRRECEGVNKKIKKYNNFFEENLYKELYKYSKHIFYSGEFSLKTNSLWDKNIVKDSNQVIIYELKSNDSFFIKISETIKNKIGHDIKYLMFYYWTQGSHIPWNDDYHHTGSITIYLNEYWDRDFGGLFLFEENDEIKCIVPEKNMAIEQTSGVPHSVCPTSKNSDVRFTIQIFF